MKRIAYGAENLVTGDAVADALLRFAETMTGTRSGVAISIPVLDEAGGVRSHTLLITPSTALGLESVDGPMADEEERFPVPEFPAVSVGMLPVENPDAGATMPSDEERGLSGL